MPHFSSRVVASVTAGLAGAGYLLFDSQQTRWRRDLKRLYHPSLDSDEFTVWKLREKQVLTPTNSVFALEPPDKKYEASSTHGRGPLSIKGWWGPYDELWRDGTWAVTIKQPQLQVAREYTPLPPFPPPFDLQDVCQDSGSDSGQMAAGRQHGILSDGNTSNEIRLLIRKDGETSAYVHARKLGQDVELRGPSRTLRQYGINEGKVDEIVFLAGGTGIAPAMQLAHGVLVRKVSEYERISCGVAEDGTGRSKGRDARPSDVVEHDATRLAALPASGDEPRISILWANRKREECADGQSDLSVLTDDPGLLQGLRSWFFANSPSKSPSQDMTATSPASTPTTHPIVSHLQALQRSFRTLSILHHAASLDSSATPLDTSSPANRNSPILDPLGLQRLPAGRQVVNAALAARADLPPSFPGPRLEIGYFVDEEKSYISKSLLGALLSRPPLDRHAVGPAEDKKQEASNTIAPITKRAKKLVIVSGPDGFVEHFAGRRDMIHGQVVQGRVGGVLGELQREGKLDGWEVVKM
ncbi:hypothetical protein CAC42_3695 [Sphaceloma murrayae]|uniref:FAD-binding FR-type domain-containing protein n=1 Tax=Sphaceloma murrayae TaxID=2082308 RepID=A0A2K1QHM5_9PEZI|nr:hypothetical protein CAC42_3695 [Sphaceloma murrayae]